MSKRKLLGTVFLIAPLALAGCADPGGEFAEGMDTTDFMAANSGAHELGVIHFQAGNYGLAVQHFQTATAREPRSVEAWNGLAAAYDKVGRFDLAERYYKRALVVDPQSAQTLNNIGYSYWLQTRYDLALAFLREADDLDGGNRVIQTNRKLASQSFTAAESGQKAAAPVDADALAHPLLRGEAVASSPRVERSGEGEQTLITQPEAAAEFEMERAAAPASGPMRQEAAELEPESMPSVPLEPVQSAALAEDGGLTVLEVTSMTTTFAPQAQPRLAAMPVAEESAGSKIPYLEQDSVVAELGVPVSLVDRLDEPVTFVSEASKAPAFTSAPRELTAMLVQMAETEESQRSQAAETNVMKPPRELTAVMVQMVATAEPRRGPQTAEATVPKAPRALTGKMVEYAAAHEDAASPASLALGASNPELVVAGAEIEQEDKEDSLKSSTPVYRGPLMAQAPAIEISNGAGREGMAVRLEQYISKRGLSTARLNNADTSERTQTTIYYGEGWQVYAMGLASMLPVEVSLAATDEGDADIRIEIGGDLLHFDRDLIADLGQEDDASG
jgi:tetratricopeptide (TPR) repeat protein